jgi:hypothetical protein
MPQPIAFTTAIERLILVPFVRRDVLPALPDERAFLWWQRGEELTGVSLEGDETTSGLWRHYWRSRGDAVREGAAVARQHRAASFPLSYAAALVGADLALYGFAASALALWSSLTVFFIRERRAGRPTVVAVDPDSRRGLLVGWLLCLGSVFWLAEAGRALEVVSSVDFGHADATGSAFIVSQLEKRVARCDVPPTRWAAAVAHHLAGDRDRATELYRSLPEEPRAERNLDALRRGTLVPPEPLTGADLLAAYSAEPWLSRLGRLAAPGRWLRPAFEWPDFLTPVAWATVLAGALLLLAFARAPALTAAAASSASRPASGTVPLAVRLVPGLADLWTGRVGRGYLTLVLFSFTTLFLGLQLTALAAGPRLGLGLLTSFQAFDPFRIYLVPSVYSPSSGTATLADRAWFLLSQPHAMPFLAAVAVSALTYLTLHARRLREFRRQP